MYTLSCRGVCLTVLLAISLLEQERIVGAGVDSSDRYPPPKCHPGTRQELRARISAWLVDTSRESNLFWLLGPAGVGKSAVAQTIAEECKANGQLGAAFFFSRQNLRNDPSRVIPTLVYQLLLQSPEYKNLVVQCLADDSNILQSSLRVQLSKLIVEPFRTLHTQKIFEGPLLIILDGLDECDGMSAQSGFLEVINEHVQLDRDLPLLWMVCSRPEWHLKQMLSNVVGWGIKCCRDELPVDDEAAQQDVLNFLRDGFGDLRRRFRDTVSEQWPTEVHIRQIAHASSGLFAVASAFLKFVGDESHSDPPSRLDICLEFVRNQFVITSVNPLMDLDRLYGQILANIPTDVVSTLIRVLCLRILCPGSELSVFTIVNILGLDPASFLAALRGMHSVLRIPAPEHFFKESIHFHHASFKAFLGDPRRSDVFSVITCYDSVVDSVRHYNAKKPPVQITIM